MGLYKKHKTVFDALTGEKRRKESANWWGRYRDAKGREKRVPLSPSKDIAQRQLRKILDAVILEKADLVSVTEKETKKPVALHVEDFTVHLQAKANTKKHVKGTTQIVKAFVYGCKWKNVSQITEGTVEKFLLDLREVHGRGIRTSNNYLRAIKHFTGWLLRTKRLTTDPLAYMETLNGDTDLRHDRRPLDSDEFARMVYVAETGPPRVGFLGRDRAMLYLLAAWTGFRRGELSSLTLRSFDLESSPATVTVKATYSKRKRQDVQVLHPDIVVRFKEWILKRKPKNDREILFPLTEQTCGTDRKTSAMIQVRYWCRPSHLD